MAVSQSVCLSSVLVQLSDLDKKFQAKGGRDVQGFQAQSRRRVREQDGEHVFGIYEELGRIVSLLKTILWTQDKNSEIGSCLMKM